MAALGCLGVGTAQTGFTFGLSMTSAASTGLIFSTAPVWGILLGSVLGHERPTGRGVVGLAHSIHCSPLSRTFVINQERSRPVSPVVSSH
jgi:drug/metabolite transporter (DMT)-like permease